MNQIMHRTRVALLLSIAAISACAAVRDVHAQARPQSATYFPVPTDVGSAAVRDRSGWTPRRLAAGSPSRSPTRRRRRAIFELAHYQSFGREPFGDAVGPFKTRGDATGLIIRRGYIVAEWGDPHRVDMTFSVTKSFLSTVVGARVRPRTDSRPRRVRCTWTWRRSSCSRTRRARPARRHRSASPTICSPFDTRAQPPHHLGSPAAPDERLGGHALGQAGLGRPPRPGRRVVAHARAQGAGHVVRVQRRARERARARGAQRLAAAAAARCCAST